MTLWRTEKTFRKAVQEQGSGDYDVIESMQFVPEWTDFQLNFGFKVDGMTSIKRFDNMVFEECYPYAVIAEIEKLPVRFLHFNHIITCKKATARPKDLLDVEELEKIRKLKE